MTIYNVALNEGVNYDSFWDEIENDGSDSTYVPDRSVSIVNERPSSLRQCWYDLSDEEAELLSRDPRVFCVEIPPEQRTDITIRHTTTQTGLYYKGPNTGSNPDNTAGVNWGLFRITSTTNNTTSNSGTLNYDYDLDGTGVDVVITDGGCQVDHPEFNNASGDPRVQQINWYTASGGSGTMPSNFYTDYDGHGTHVCGITAGKTYGRAKNSNIYIMTLDGLATAPTTGISVSVALDLIKGWHNLKPVDPVTGYKRPTVVNMSWGYTADFVYSYGQTGGNYRGTSWTSGVPQPQYGMIGGGFFGTYGIRVNSTDTDVAEMLAAGIIIVGAAGNYYQTLDVPGGPDYNNYYLGTIAFPRYYMRGSTPGSSTGVITVGCVDSAPESGTLEQKASFSDSGPRVDLYAPGNDIVSATSNTNNFGATAQYPNNASYLIMSISGTSQASPQVAGLCAQLCQANPGYTPAQIRSLVISTSTANALFSTGLSTDYEDSRSLHGGPNQFAYLAQAAPNTPGISITGGITLSNITIT